MTCIAQQDQISPHFALVQTSTTAHEQYTETTEVFNSQAIPLAPGQMIFTDPKKTKLTMPTGRYAITAFRGEIVDGANKSVPLSEVYDHHWIANDKFHKNELCPEIHYVFGIGAESRNSPVAFPKGYGYIVEDNDEWGANIHLLYTTDLAGSNSFKAAKECNECYYAPGKASACTPEQNGTFQCCGENCLAGSDSCKCPTKNDAPKKSKNFFLRYQLSYTKDVDAIKPLQIGVFTAPKCKTFYDVQRNDEHPENLATMELEMPVDATVLLAMGHQHTGSLNISLFQNGKFVCASFPTYGTELGVAGNEKGYLVKMSPCIDETTGPLVLTKGDKLRLDSWYNVATSDPRLGYSDGTHLNVMGYMYTAYVRHGAVPGHHPSSPPHEGHGGKKTTAVLPVVLAVVAVVLLVSAVAIGFTLSRRRAAQVADPAGPAAGYVRQD